MKTTFLVLVAGAAISLLSPGEAAPTKPIVTYDKRQDGKLNVDTKLNNILFLFAPPASYNANVDVATLIENALLTQSIGLRNVIPRIADRPENEDSIDSGIGGDESAGKKSEGPEASAKLISGVQRDSPEVGESSKPQSNLENEKEVKSQIDTQETGEKSKKSARSLKKVSGELSVSKLPPIEKQLPLENKVAGKNEREDPAGQADREPQELKLIGGGIENCGPDRFRDRFGICQARVESQ